MFAPMARSDQRAKGETYLRGLLLEDRKSTRLNSSHSSSSYAVVCLKKKTTRARPRSPAPPVLPAIRAGVAGRRAGRQAQATRSRARRDSVETITPGLCRVADDNPKACGVFRPTPSAALRFRRPASQ